MEQGNGELAPKSKEVLSHAGSSGSVRTLITIGLLIGMVLGMVGNFFPFGTAKNVIYALSSLGIVLGGSLYATRLFRQQKDLTAIGFILWAFGEAIILTAGHPGDPTAEITYASATSIQGLGLLVASLSASFSIWVRIAGTLSGICFSLHFILWLFGQLNPSNSIFTNIGYPLLMITIIGWLIALLRRSTD